MQRREKLGVDADGGANRVHRLDTRHACEMERHRLVEHPLGDPESLEADFHLVGEAGEHPACRLGVEIEVDFPEPLEFIPADRLEVENPLEQEDLPAAVVLDRLLDGARLGRREGLPDRSAKVWTAPARSIAADQFRQALVSRHDEARPRPVRRDTPAAGHQDQERHDNQAERPSPEGAPIHHCRAEPGCERCHQTSLSVAVS